VSLKYSCKKTDQGYWLMENGVKMPVRIFMNDLLFMEAEESLFGQIVTATEFPGVKEVVITPDAHHGYEVPVGCVLATDGALCQAPVGFDIGCGMMALRSDAPMEKGLDEKKRRNFSELVMERIALGAGGHGSYSVDEKKFQEIIRTGANAIGYSRENSERDYIPVDDGWTVPHLEGKQAAKDPFRRGLKQLKTLGGGNHFIELQYDQNGKLWTMVHTGSRGFGHGLATYFIEIGKERLKKEGKKGSAEAVYFLPDDPHYRDYKNAVAAGANFAIANRLLIWEGVAQAFRRAFGQEPELVYEISHNLAQFETHPGKGEAVIHRKGATRAFPAGHPMLKGTKWENTGHPILIPGSMGDKSYILYAEPGAEKSLYSVNHGCGRRMSRGEANRTLTQSGVNRQMKELNVMVNAGGNVPIDESPNCYKPAEEVIGSVVEAGLARVAFTLTPIASIKGVD
jgi:tRNA-splicing ligase RtcB